MMSLKLLTAVAASTLGLANAYSRRGSMPTGSHFTKVVPGFGDGAFPPRSAMSTVPVKAAKGLDPYKLDLTPTQVAECGQFNAMHFEDVGRSFSFSGLGQAETSSEFEAAVNGVQRARSDGYDMPEAPQMSFEETKKNLLQYKQELDKRIFPGVPLAPTHLPPGYVAPTPAAVAAPAVVAPKAPSPLSVKYTAGVVQAEQLQQYLKDNNLPTPGASINDWRAFMFAKTKTKKEKDGTLTPIIDAKNQRERYKYMVMVTNLREQIKKRHVASLKLLARRLPQNPTGDIDLGKIPDKAAPRPVDPYKEIRQAAERQDQEKVQNWRQCLIDLIEQQPEVNYLNKATVTEVINTRLSSDLILQKAGEYERLVNVKDKENFKHVLFTYIGLLVERKQPTSTGGLFGGFKNVLPRGIWA